MRVPVVRALAAVSCLVLLSGCETVRDKIAAFRLPAGFGGAADPETTGSVGPGFGETVTNGQITVDQSGLTGQPIGADPNDDLQLGKRHFREQNFGLAEKHFRRAVESSPGPVERDTEAWLGLAASYDRLRRFELADRAYAQAIKLAGPKPEILNNQGYSYILRGDYRKARTKLAAAQARDPGNPYIRNNIELLEKSIAAR